MQKNEYRVKFIKIDNDYQVVPFEDQYYKDVISLWCQQYSKKETECRKKIFKWIVDGNPYKNESPGYYIVLHEGKVVGMHGHMPLVFSISGKGFPCFMSHDVLLHMAFRGKGLGKIIIKSVFRNSDDFSGALWFNESSYKLYRKCGWTDVTGLESYVRIYNPHLFLKSKIMRKIFQNYIAGLTKFFTPYIYRLKKIRKNNCVLEINEINFFGHEFDLFFDAVSHQYGIMVMRKHLYLNWKFVYKPFANYRKFAAYESSGRLVGYMVIKSETFDEYRRGRIIDYLYDGAKPEVFLSLLERSCEELEKDAVDYIQIITSLSNIKDLLKKRLFLKATNPVRFMVKNFEQKIEKDYVTNINNWHITDSDGDGDAWSVDTK